LAGPLTGDALGTSVAGCPIGCQLHHRRGRLHGGTLAAL